MSKSPSPRSEGHPFRQTSTITPLGPTTTQITAENPAMLTPPHNNQSTKPVIECKENHTIPKSHETLIRNTFKSLSSEEGCTKTTPADDEKKDKCRKRLHKAGDILLLKNKHGILKTVGDGNYNKKTYCYKLVTEEGVKYFVKIFEDSKRKPTKVSKKLFTNKALRCKMAPYLLIPAFKPQLTPLDSHTYEVVIYPFIEHCNLQHITLNALRTKYINPSYHTSHPPKPPHGAGYKMRMLRRFEQCVTIAIVMKDGGNGYVDMDISPDNLIIRTDVPNAVDAIESDKIRWDLITDAKDAKLIKIDHESMMKWKKQFHHVDKPMKDAFRAPEVNRQRDDGEFDAFDVEKANVYQYGATFVYVLYGQMKSCDGDGYETWKSLPPLGNGNWINTKWTPCYIDLPWLQDCLHSKPGDRPTYDLLLRNIKQELSKFRRPSSKHIRQQNQFGDTKRISHRQRRPNNFNSAHFMSNNGAVTMVHTPSSLQQSMNNTITGQRRRMNNFNDVPTPSAQRQPMMQRQPPQPQYQQPEQRRPRTRPPRQQKRNNFGDTKPNNFSQNVFSNSNKKQNKF